MIVRILRPTRLTAEQLEITRTRQSFSRSSTRDSSTSSDNIPSEVSMDTVTFVSDVETRSTDTPLSLNAAKALARKPTSCHMPTPSIEISVSPLRIQIPLTCGSTSSVTDEITVPAMSGEAVLRINKGMSNSRTGVKQRGCKTVLPADASSCASS